MYNILSILKDAKAVEKSDANNKAQIQPQTPKTEACR